MNNKVDIDDVLITGQHQAFLGDIANIVVASNRTERAETDVCLVSFLDVGFLNGADRPRRPKIQARLCGVNVTAEKKFDTVFTRLHTVQAAKQPDDDDKK